MASEDPSERPRRALVARVVAALLATAVGVACSGSTFTGSNPSDAGAGGTGGSTGGSGGTAGKGSGGTSSGGSTSTGGTSSGGRGGASSGGDGGSDDSGGTGAGGSGGSGNASGSGGSGNAAGDAGDSGAGGGGNAGSGGSAGQGGVGGAGAGGVGGVPGGSGGSGNAAGAGGSGTECQTAADCQLVSDCCRCEAEPKRKADAPVCEQLCVIDQCGSKQIEPDEVACVFGRCVIDRSCDRSRVTCKLAEPVCPEGSVPSVEGSCYGPCLPATECSSVTGCDDCTEPAVCVRNEAQLLTYGCVLPPQGCNKGSYCSCLGACVAPFGACGESESAVGCACPNC